jgi:hypothetical protein
MMVAAEADLRKELPQFNARALIGVSFDTFHENPSHQRNLLAHLRGTHRAQIKVGSPGGRAQGAVQGQGHERRRGLGRVLIGLIGAPDGKLRRTRHAGFGERQQYTLSALNAGRHRPPAPHHGARSTGS